MSGTWQAELNKELKEWGAGAQDPTSVVLGLSYEEKIMFIINKYQIGLGYINLIFSLLDS